jgi:flavin-binding protein dodecin
MREERSGDRRTHAAGSSRGEVVKTDMTVEDGKVQAYRTRVLLSLKYES